MPLLTTGAGTYPLAAGGATTTLDPSNLGTAQVLSNGNLTDTGSGNGIAHSVASHSSGKYYCEVTIGIRVNSGIGVMPSGNTVNTFIGAGSTIGMGYGGAYLGSVGGTTTCDTLVNAHVFAIAVDIDNRAMWIKDLTAAGNWNANGTANPATNTNGATFTGTLTSGAVLVGVTCGNAGDNSTFNFGATAYTGTPPSGFVNW